MRRTHEVVLVFVCFLAAVIFGGCGSDPTGPSDSGNGGNTPAETLESRTEAVDSSGGVIALEGVELAIPENAVPESQSITVARLEPSSLFDGDSGSRAVVSVEGMTGDFVEPVELRVALPEGMTEADSTSVFAGVIDDETGAVTMEPVTIRMIDDKHAAVLSATHFSSRLFEWFTGPTPPSSKTLSVPYYNQGPEPFCWAASVHMVTTAAGAEATDELVDIIGSMGVDEGGITAFSFRYSTTLSALVNVRTGVSPDRAIWDYFNSNQMKYYLKRQIGTNNRPVALFSSVWNHAVVVVGYDGDTFYIHDPACISAGAIGTTARSWNDIAGGMGAFDRLVTLTVPKAMNSSRPSVTIGLESGTLRFLKPGTGAGNPTRMYGYDWDHTEKSGYSFHDNSSGDKTSPIPGEVTELQPNGGITVYNSSQSAASEVSVWIDVTAVDTPQTRYCTHNEQVTVGANSAVTVPFPEILVDEFRYNATGKTKYFLSVRSMVGGAVTDEESLTFDIASLPVTIESLQPASGSPGATVAVRGTGFGSIAGHGALTFDGVPVEVDSTYWSDTSIIFTVPADAAAGVHTVRVAHDEVESGAAIFTVTDATTESGTFSRSASLFGNRDYEATVNWTATGVDLEVYEDLANYSFWIRGRQDTTLDLVLDTEFEHEFEKYRSEWLGSDGYKYYAVTTYSDIRLAAMPAGADEADDPHDVVRIYGHVPCVLSSTGGGNYTLSCTLSDDWYAQKVQLLLWCVYDEHVEYYKVTENGEELQRTVDRDDQSFWIVDFNLTTTANK